MAGLLSGAPTMKKMISQFFLLLLLLSSPAFAQYAAVDAKVRSYPTSFSDADKLASRINADFD